MRRTVSVLFLLLLPSALACGSAVTAEQKQIQLQKMGDFYLRPGNEQKWEITKLSVPSLIVLSNAGAVLKPFERIYFYDDKLNLINTAGGKGLKPGLFPYVALFMTLSDRGEVAVSDVRGRINIYDQSGAFKRSWLVPDLKLSVDIATEYGNMIIVSGFYYDGRGRIVVFDSETAKKVSEFFVIDEDEIAFLESKNALSFSLYPWFTVSPKGHIICNRRHDHRVFEFTLSGDTVHVYDEVPPHYVPLSSAKQGLPDDELVRSLDAGWDWVATWTYSGGPSIHGTDMFVVPRRTAPPFYLDFYSLSEKAYLGYCNLENKRFLFSDSNYIYLCEDFSDTLLVVGKYVALIGGRKEGMTIAEAIPDSLLEPVVKSAIDIDDSMLSFVPKAEFKIVDLEGEEHSFKEFLIDADRHFVIFLAPFYHCPFIRLYESVRDFCAENRRNALYVVVNHPYKEELEFLIKGLELDARIIPNLEPQLVKDSAPIFPYPGLIVLNKDGTKVLGKYTVYDQFGENPKCIDLFLKEICDMDSTSMHSSE